jgi:transcriptional regulator with XRE-family HTH domain/mannose-6-phosphate isomerase-like protein (cupin superfamily)
VASRAAIQGPSPDELGQRLRTAREAHGISLRALAKRIDVSPSFISQVELGRAKPSVATLYALVTELGISLDDVMTDDATNGVSPAAADEPSPSWHPHAQAEVTESVAPPPGIGQHVQQARGRRAIKMSGVVWERLTPDDDPLVDFLYVTYAPGSASCSADDLMRHGGREYGHILHGHIEVQVGFETHELAPGDSIHFDSTTPHRLSNPFDEPCTAIWVVVGRRGDTRTPPPTG